MLGLNPKFARPDWMILQALPIPPPPVRPSVMMDSSARSEVIFLILFYVDFLCSVFIWWCVLICLYNPIVERLNVNELLGLVSGCHCVSAHLTTTGREQ